VWPHSAPKGSGSSAGRGGSSRKNATAPGTETLLRPPRTPGSERAWSRSRSWSSTGAFWSSWVCGFVGVVAGRGPRRAGKSSGTIAGSSHAQTQAAALPSVGMSPVRPTVQVVGRRMDAEHYRLRDFLTRTAQPYEWFEVGSAEADALLEQLDLRDATLPVLVDGGDTYTAATVESMALA